jgi:UDP-GlcNAc:undecaprenyl-phosphate GlcNAc-1-phosphate transferase
MNYGAIFLATAVGSALLTFVVRLIVLKSGKGLAVPRDRDVHTKPIPRLGGVAVTLAFLIATLVVYALSPASLTLLGAHVLGLDRSLWGVIAGVVLLMLVGALDDIYGLSPVLKLFFHVLAGILLASSLVLVPYITNPFGGRIELGMLAYPVVVVWVVLMINAINWLDGLDGLASGVSLIASFVLFLLALRPDVGQPSIALLAFLLAAALAGFLPFNFFPAKIFLGDSGSQVLGFLLAVFAIISGGKLATAFLVLGVPILDTIWVITRRFLAHQPIYKADRYHLHHRLLRAGLNQRQAVILMYTLIAAFGIIALETQSISKLIALLILIGIMIIGGAFLVTLDNLKHKEVV